MPTVISYNRYSLKAMKRAIKWILRPDKLMTLSWRTVKSKLDNKDVLFSFIIHRECQYNIVRSYVKESKQCTTEERIRLSSSFKIVDCLTGQDLEYKYIV